MKNKSLVIVCGDPKSTFNEILIKAIKNKVLKNKKYPIVIVGSKKLFEVELKKLKKKVNLEKFENHTNLRENNIYFKDIPLDQTRLTLNKINKYISESFKMALKLIKENRSFALINGPISKTTFLYFLS